MSRPSSFQLGCLAGPMIAALLWAGCGDPEQAADAVEPSLSEVLAEVGLEPGNWRVEHGGNSVCIRRYTAPGNIVSDEAIGLSGFATFELRVSADEQISLGGTSDILSARYTAEQCVEYDAGVDAVTHLEPCSPEEEERSGCPPFSLVRLCGNEGAPTFFARVPDCGSSTFPATRQ